MKVSCLPVSLYPFFHDGTMNLQDWIGISKSCGLDGADINMTLLHDHTPLYLQSIKDKIAESDVPVVMATTYPDFTHPDALQRDRESEYLRRDIAVCSQLGVRYLRVLAGQAHPATSVPEGIRWAVEHIGNASRIAGKFGVMLLYEDHSRPHVWEYYDFSYPPDIFLEIAEGIRNTGVRINFDTGNILAYGGDTLTVLKKILPLVETVHVSDMKREGEFTPVPIGTGAVPFRDIFGLLKKSGFDGWLCIEEASCQGLEGIKQAVTTVRKLWQES